MNDHPHFRSHQTAKAIGLFAMLALIGCAGPALKSKRVVHGDKTQNGISYFLPKVLVQLVADLQTQRVTSTENSTEETYAVTVNLLTVPDTAHFYRLRIKPALHAYDHFNITINPNGFLSSVNASNQDRTASIVTTIAQTIANAAEAAMRLTPEDRAAFRQRLPKHREFIFDPTSPCELSKANEVFHINDIDLVTITCKPVSGPLCEMRRTKPGPDKEGGVFYRPALPYLFSVKSASTTGNVTNTQTVLMLPNEAPVFYIPFNRAAFATVSRALTFTNGFLSSVDYSKTSEIEGFVSIPFELSKMAVSVPTNLIQLKVDLATRNAELIKQQQALSDNQAGLLNSVSNLQQRQQAFEEFMRTNKPR